MTTSTSSPKQQQQQQQQQQREAGEDEERQGRLERGDEGNGGDNSNSNNNPPAPFREEEKDDENGDDEDIDDHDDKDNAVPPPTGTVTAAEKQQPPAALSATNREVKADREDLAAAGAAAAAPRTAPIEREEAAGAATMPGGIDDDDDTILPAPPPTTIPSSSSSATGNGLVVVAVAAAATTTTTITMSTGSMIEGMSREELERQYLSMEGKVQSMEGKVHSMEGQVQSMEGQVHSMEGQVHSMEGKVHSMEGELRAVTGENQTLRRNQQAPSQSMFSELVLAFVAGLFGVSPPLFVDIDAVLRWAGWTSLGRSRGPNGSGDDGPAGGNPPSTTEALREEEEQEEDGVGSESGDDNDRGGRWKAFLHRLRKNPRLPVYVFVSLLDLVDAIVDIAVSVQALLDDFSEVDNDRVVKGWALVLFFGTILARLLGGLFGVVYHRIDDKTDRECSYVAVESIIWVLEDWASIAYLAVKWEKGGKPNRLELVSLGLTIICGVVFGIETCVQQNRYRNRHPRYVDEVNLLVMTEVFAILGTKKGLVARSICDTLFRVLYPVGIIGILLPTFWFSRSVYRGEQPRTSARQFDWSRSLYEKYRYRTTARPSQTHEFPDPSVPAGDDLAS